MIETTSDEFTYCVLSPQRINENGQIEGGKAFGVGPTIDSTEAYDVIFGTSNEMYQILSMCIYEVKGLFDSF
jgi:hypothetical protein